MKATVKQIFNEISSLNPSVSTVSSIGSFVSASSRMVSEAIYAEILPLLPEVSLAHKILTSSENYTEKQLWVIAYELVKNEEYSEKVGNAIEAREAREASKKVAKKANRNAKAQARKEIEERGCTVYGIGTQVRHAQLGTGEVVEENGENVTVRFGEIEKILLKKFAKLEIL